MSSSRPRPVDLVSRVVEQAGQRRDLARALVGSSSAGRGAALPGTLSGVAIFARR
jgi:hypothetical protein